MAVHRWIETNLVAKEFTRTGDDDDMSAFNSVLQDYTTSVANHHSTLNIDKRVIAIGGDPEMKKWDMVASPTDGWAANIWMAIMMRRAFEVLGGGSNILMAPIVPSKHLMNELNDRSKTYTFINSPDLYNFEKFILTHPDYASYSDTQYSAMDVQDVVAGTNAGTFDFVALRATNIINFGTEILDAYLAMLKVGGLMGIAETANYSSLYDSKAQYHKNCYTKFNRHIASKTNLNVYHMPIDHGYTIVKRVS